MGEKKRKKTTTLQIKNERKKLLHKCLTQGW
jgi:hypothetical protein